MKPIFCAGNGLATARYTTLQALLEICKYHIFGTMILVVSVIFALNHLSGVAKMNDNGFNRTDRSTQTIHVGLSPDSPILIRTSDAYTASLNVDPSRTHELLNPLDVASYVSSSRRLSGRSLTLGHWYLLTLSRA